MEEVGRAVEKFIERINEDQLLSGQEDVKISEPGESEDLKTPESEIRKVLLSDPPAEEICLATDIELNTDHGSNAQKVAQKIEDDEESQVHVESDVVGKTDGIELVTEEASVLGGKESAVIASDTETLITEIIESILAEVTQEEKNIEGSQEIGVVEEVVSEETQEEEDKVEFNPESDYSEFVEMFVAEEKVDTVMKARIVQPVNDEEVKENEDDVTEKMIDKNSNAIPEKDPEEVEEEVVAESEPCHTDTNIPKIIDVEYNEFVFTLSV